MAMILTENVRGVLISGILITIEESKSTKHTRRIQILVIITEKKILKYFGGSSVIWGQFLKGIDTGMTAENGRIL